MPISEIPSANSHYSALARSSLSGSQSSLVTISTTHPQPSSAQTFQSHVSIYSEATKNIPAPNLEFNGNTLKELHAQADVKDSIREFEAAANSLTGINPSINNEDMEKARKAIEVATGKLMEHAISGALIHAVQDKLPTLVDQANADRQNVPKGLWGKKVVYENDYPIEMFSEIDADQHDHIETGMNWLRLNFNRAFIQDAQGKIGEVNSIELKTLLLSAGMKAHTEKGLALAGGGGLQISNLSIPVIWSGGQARRDPDADITDKHWVGVLGFGYFNNEKLLCLATDTLQCISEKLGFKQEEVVSQIETYMPTEPAPVASVDENSQLARDRRTQYHAVAEEAQFSQLQGVAPETDSSSASESEIDNIATRTIKGLKNILLDGSHEFDAGIGFRTKVNVSKMASEGQLPGYIALKASETAANVVSSFASYKAHEYASQGDAQPFAAGALRLGQIVSHTADLAFNGAIVGLATDNNALDSVDFQPFVSEWSALTLRKDTTSHGEGGDEMSFLLRSGRKRIDHTISFTTPVWTGLSQRFSN